MQWFSEMHLDPLVQAALNDTAAWQTPPAGQPAAQAALTPTKLALWAVASLLVYCVYEQIRFKMYR